jgi:hypothetical protein
MRVYVNVAVENHMMNAVARLKVVWSFISPEAGKTNIAV